MPADHNAIPKEAQKDYPNVNESGHAVIAVGYLDGAADRPVDVIIEMIMCTHIFYVKANQILRGGQEPVSHRAR